jgi:hypothetical protein
MIKDKKEESKLKELKEKYKELRKNIIFLILMI